MYTITNNAVSTMHINAIKEMNPDYTYVNDRKVEADMADGTIKTATVEILRLGVKVQLDGIYAIYESAGVRTVIDVAAIFHPATDYVALAKEACNNSYRFRMNPYSDIYTTIVDHGFQTRIGLGVSIEADGVHFYGRKSGNLIDFNNELAVVSYDQIDE